MRRARNPRVEEAERLKEAGNGHFTAKPQPRVREAAEAYTRGMAELDESGVDNEPEPLALRCTLLQNRAACRLQLKQFAGCLEDCNEVLAFDRARTKARYRRGLAYEGMGRYGDALKDLMAVYAVDTSPPVEDAVDRVELLRDLQPLGCEWRPDILAKLGEEEEGARGRVLYPSRRDMAIIRDVVGAAFVKLARSIEKRGRRPSPTVMKLLGIYSGDEEVDFARAKCVALAYSQGAGPFSAIHVTGWWFQAKDTEEWMENAVLDMKVKDTPWARTVRERGGLPGRFNSRIPGQPDVKEALPPPRAAPAPSPASRQRSSSSSSGSGSGSGGGSVIGAEEAGRGRVRKR